MYCQCFCKLFYFIIQVYFVWLINSILNIISFSKSHFVSFLLSGQTTSSLSFFLVRPAKRKRYANDHARNCMWRKRETARSLLSGLPRLNIVKNPCVRTYNFFNSGRRKKKVLVFWGSYWQLRLSRFLVSMKEM